MKTARRLISLLLVLCLFVGDMGITAFAESILALPVAMEIIDEEAFYGAKSLDKVVLPDHLKEIRSRAFANSSVKTINLPSSLTFIADDAFDEAPLTNVTAVEGTYAYNWAVDHHYIIPKVPITIHSIRANVATVETGTPITWTVIAEGGVAPLSYNYAVFKNGMYQDTFSVSETEESEFVFTPSTSGYWSVLVTISDSLDTIASEISESVYVVDIASYGDIELTLTPNLNTYLVGDTVQITAEKVNTYGAVQYSFSAKDASDNVLASQSASSGSSFSFTASEAGDITINGIVTDELGRNTSAQRTIHVYTEDELKPAAPQSIQMNGDTLPTDANQSMLYPQQNYKLSWDKVNNADSYHIQVVKTEGEASTTLIDIDAISDTTYTISADLFASIEQEALVQIKISAQTRITGDPVIGYYRVKTSEQQHAILIDGKLSSTWNEVFSDAATRDFTISSDVDWTFTPDQDWITCYCDNDRLTVVLTENPYKSQVISGTVTISNGAQSAQIVITHGYLEEAPQLLTPSLSPTESASISQPFGDLYLRFDEKRADHVTAKLYKKNGSEYTYIAEESTNKSTMCLSVPSSIHAGDLCMLELIGYTEAGFQTKDRSAQRTTARYYFTFSNEQHFIQVDGQETSSYQIIDTVTVQIHASTVWNWQSDCDWLQIIVSNDEFAPDCKAYIRATANQTGEKRIGHLTITSGTSTAQITVMQDSFIPYVSYPTGLSQSANSPTTLPMNNLSFIWHMASYISIIRDSDGFVMLQSPSNPQTGDSIIDVDTESFEKADWKANSTYTITLSNDYYTSYYYFKIGTSNSYYINLSDSENSEVNILNWNVSAEAQTKTVTMKASGAWTITTDSDWLSVSATSGSKTTAGKVITVTVQQNTTGVERNGNIIFKRGTYAEAVLHIEQTANNYLIVMNSDTLVPYSNNDTIYHVSGKNDDFSLRVKTGCAWSVSSDSSWLAFDRSGSTTKNVTSTNTTLRIYCAENTIGNQTRVAKLTFSAGNESFVLFISQDACIDVPVVSTAITSTNINNPSVILYQDINFTWSPVAGAAKYVVKVMTSASDSTQQYYVEEDGSSEYSFTIPYSWLTVDGKAYFFRVNSIDHQGYEYTAPRYCYTVVYDEKATINGSTQPSWNNASDYQASQEFIVMSTSSWTAVSQQSWIHVSPTNGESGDTLTVTLDDNTGARREGSARISVNGNVTTLSISQCAKLAEWPTIISPAYSEDEYNPTIISSNISSLTVTWDVEPQADSYFIHIDSYKNTGTWHGEKEIENISVAQAGSYTINNLQLTTDKLYKLTLVRCANGRGNAGTSVYFIPQNGLSTVSLGSYDPSTAELDGEGGYQRYTINSSGTWIATTDSDWIMVYRKSLDQEDLDENGRTPSYYDSMVGNPGTALYISALANHTGASRYDNVTVSCGSASLTNPVSQDMYILPAQLTSPSLGSSPSQITNISYSDLKLRWSRGEGGNCTYSLTLKGKAHGERSYDTILEKDLGSKLNYTISRSYLEEGYDYLLRLTTEVDGLSSDWETYYFHVKYENELTARIQLTSSQIMLGSTVAVSASATGGAGQYRYSYELLRNNSTINQTDLGAGDSYSFDIVNAGTYQIKVTVVDGSDETAFAFTPVFIVGDETTIVTGSVRTSAGEGLSNIYVYAVNTTDEADVQQAVTNANGIWQIGLKLGQTYSFEYVSFDYNIPGSTETIISGLNVNAVAQLSGTTSNDFTFTMKQNGQSVSSIQVGTAVDFTVQASDARYVRLAVDGTLYEQYAVQNGTVQFTRTFSASGNREVKFKIWLEGEDDYTIFTPVQLLNVTCDNDSLGEANIHAIGAYALNSGIPLTITWDAVPHANDYAVYVYYDGCLFYPLDIDSMITHTGGETSFTFPDSYPLWVSDKWSVQVVTTGEGWDSSSSTAFFSVIATEALAQFTELPQGNTAMLGSSFAVTIGSALPGTDLSLSVLPPQNGQIVDIFDLGNGRYVVRADHPGTYTLQAFTDGASEPTDQAEIIVAGPALSQFKQGAYSQYAWYVQGTSISFSVSANFIPDSVALLCDGIAVQTWDNTEAQDSFFTIADPNTLNDLGRHTYTICASYGGYSVITERPFPVYVMSSNPDVGRTRYASVETTLYTYPGQGSGQQLTTGTAVTAGEGIYNNLMLIVYNKQEYFITAADLTATPPEIAEPILSVQPAFSMPEVVEINTNQAYVVETAEGVTAMEVKVEFSSNYSDNGVTGFKNIKTITCAHNEENLSQFKFSYTYDQLGTYMITLTPKNSLGRALSAKTYPVITYEPIEHSTVYLKNVNSMYLNLFPYKKSMTSPHIVLWTTPIRIEGRASESIYYVSINNQTKYGFIPIDETSTYQGVGRKRGYIIMSDDCAKSSIGERASQACHSMHCAFESMGIDVVVDNRNITKYGLLQLLDEIASQNSSNENDTTYIYIVAHGLENSKGESLNKMVMNSTVWSDVFEFNKSAIDYSQLAGKLKKIKGRVVVFINNCFGGDLLDEFASTANNKEKFTIITASRSFEPAHVTATPVMTLTDNEGNEQTIYTVYIRNSYFILAITNYLSNHNRPVYLGDLVNAINSAYEGYGLTERSDYFGNSTAIVFE